MEEHHGNASWHLQVHKSLIYRILLDEAQQIVSFEEHHGNTP